MQCRDQDGGPGSLSAAIAGAVRAAAPAGASPAEWVAESAPLTVAEAVALLGGTLNPSVELADAVLRACAGSSLPRLVQRWER